LVSVVEASPLRSIKIKTAIFEPLNEGKTDEKVIGFENPAHVLPPGAKPIMKLYYISMLVLAGVTSLLNFSMSLEVKSSGPLLHHISEFQISKTCCHYVKVEPCQR
jgi:hypothetical protein